MISTYHLFEINKDNIFKNANRGLEHGVATLAGVVGGPIGGLAGARQSVIDNLDDYEYRKKKNKKFPKYYKTKNITRHVAAAGLGSIPGVGVVSNNALTYLRHKNQEKRK